MVSTDSSREYEVLLLNPFKIPCLILNPLTYKVPLEMKQIHQTYVLFEVSRVS